MSNPAASSYALGQQQHSASVHDMNSDQQATTVNYILTTIREIIEERGDKVPELTPETAILESGLDSLDIAALVSRLEQQYGFDPFADETLLVFPRTLDELASLYRTSSARAIPRHE